MPRFEVRCHEWGDDSDYHWCYCNTLEAALQTMKEFYIKEPDNIYERLYVFEIDDDGTPISVPEYNRETFEII